MAKTDDGRMQINSLTLRKRIERMSKKTGMNFTTILERITEEYADAFVTKYERKTPSLV